jgi:rhamnulokinase
LDSPNVSPEAAQGNFTNERCVDGRVRFLKNVAGFWVINRLHQELPGVPERVADWLAGADLNETRRLDLDAAGLFAPESMLAAAREQIDGPEPSLAEWAGIALHSLIDALAGLPAELGRITGRRFTKIRVGGGGSRSEAFRELLARQSGLTVEVGTVEASVLGNLAMQLVAQGTLTLEEARAVVARS